MGAFKLHTGVLIWQQRGGWRRREWPHTSPCSPVTTAGRVNSSHLISGEKKNRKSASRSVRSKANISLFYSLVTKSEGSVCERRGKLPCVTIIPIIYQHHKHSPAALQLLTSETAPASPANHSTASPEVMGRPSKEGGGEKGDGEAPDTGERRPRLP